jgi:hypothetical protein
MAPLSNIEIVDVARAMYDMWQQQSDRYDSEFKALSKRCGVCDFTPRDPDDGYTFKTQGRSFTASWWGEVYDPHGDEIEELPLMPEPERAAIHFAVQLTRLLNSCCAAVRRRADELGWCPVDDTDYEEIFYHPDSELLISVPYWCGDFDDIRFREVAADVVLR